MYEGLDIELKTLMQGQAVDGDVFSWGVNNHKGVATASLHQKLGLDPEDEFLDKRLAIYQCLLYTFGVKSDNKFTTDPRSLDTNSATLTEGAPINWVSTGTVHNYITTMITLVGDTAEARKLLLTKGLLDDYFGAESSSEKLALILTTLIK